MTKICALSDLHGILPEIKPCELVLIAGDIIPLNIQRTDELGALWFLHEFTDWINNLPCKKVVMVAGNHDFLLEKAPFVGSLIEDATKSKLTYLLGNTYKFVDNEGSIFKIFGSPMCHEFFNWAFMYDDPFLEGYYHNIPEDTSIILTHDTPALGDLDLLPANKYHSEPIHAGNKPLAEAIKRIEPRYVFCGHLHECKDKYLKLDNTEIYNVSILDNHYKELYKPLYLDI